MRTFGLWLALGWGTATATAHAEKVAGPQTTRAVLLDDNKPVGGCGTFEIWTVLGFDVSGDPNGPRGTKVDPKRIPVAIPCVELTRPQYARSAGTAGVLVKGKTYLLTLDNPRTSNKWTGLAWGALRIDAP